MKFNKEAFSSIDDRRYKNWDGYSLAYTYDFIKAIEPYLNMEEIEFIFEIGSRDGCQAMEFSDWFPESKVYLFEPVESSFNYCKNIQTKDRSNIESHNLAISNVNGEVEFYIVANNGNIGASSLLKTKYDKSDILWGGNQIKSKVKSIKAVDFIKENNIKAVDLIWIDVQGAEKIVLESFENELSNVKAVYAEVAVNSSYENGVNLEDILKFMMDNNFEPIKNIGSPNHFTEFDIVFLNKKYIK